MSREPVIDETPERRHPARETTTATLTPAIRKKVRKAEVFVDELGDIAAQRRPPSL